MRRTSQAEFGSTVGPSMERQEFDFCVSVLSARVYFFLSRNPRCQSANERAHTWWCLVIGLVNMTMTYFKFLKIVIAHFKSSLEKNVGNLRLCVLPCCTTWVCGRWCWPRQWCCVRVMLCLRHQISATKLIIKYAVIAGLESSDHKIAIWKINWRIKWSLWERWTHMHRMWE